MKQEHHDILFFISGATYWESARRDVVPGADEFQPPWTSKWTNDDREEVGRRADFTACCLWALSSSNHSLDLSDRGKLMEEEWKARFEETLNAQQRLVPLQLHSSHIASLQHSLRMLSIQATCWY